jgi:hypothetical protein
MEEDDEFEDDVPQTQSWPSWTTFCQDPDAEDDWPEELEGREDEDF